MTDHALHGDKHLRGFSGRGRRSSCLVFLRAPRFYIGSSFGGVLGVMEADVRFLKVLVRCCRAPAVMHSQVWVHGSGIKEWAYC